MDKLKNQTPNFTEENIEKVAGLFPECVTESKNEEGVLQKTIDFDLLKQELSKHIVNGPKERYRLDWPGKREALLNANTPITKTLRPCREESVNFDTTENLFIEGDNLDALKLLQNMYLGKIKMIYIDPPYNTGKDFIYKDNFSKKTEDYLQETNQKDEEGNKLVANLETNGRFHSDWLTMMYPRLKLARNLLQDDGVIFISIDDNEVHNLRKMCDEIFGEDNFVAELIWERAYSPKNDAKYISKSHDYILLYSKSIDLFNVGRLKRSKEADNRYRNPDNDPRGPWKSSDLSVKTYNSSCDYTITTPSGRIVKPPAGRCWSLSKKSFLERLQDNRIWFGSNNDSVPSIKRFLSELRFEGMSPTSILFYKNVGHSQEGAKKVVSLFEGESFFDGPKPVRLLDRLITIANSSPDSIVLDFFAGSSTTAHAVMKMNAEDGGKRRFIMVQLPEPCEEKSEAFKAGYKNIAEISKERIRRAGKKIVTELREEEKKEEQSLLDNSSDTKRSASLDIGFRVLKVDSGNMNNIARKPDKLEQEKIGFYVENVKEERSPKDLLFQVLLDLGIGLTLPIVKNTILENEVFVVNPLEQASPELIACFSKDGKITEELCKELAKLKPLKVVFRDEGFKSDDTKINVEQIFKLLSPESQVNSI